MSKKTKEPLSLEEAQHAEIGDVIEIPLSDGHVLPMTLASKEQCEEVDMVICAREGVATPFDDNLKGVCSYCGHAIIFRPHVPMKPPKVCIECVLDMQQPN